MLAGGKVHGLMCVFLQKGRSEGPATAGAAPGTDVRFPSRLPVPSASFPPPHTHTESEAQIYSQSKLWVTLGSVLSGRRPPRVATGGNPYWPGTRAV